MISEQGTDTQQTNVQVELVMVKSYHEQAIPTEIISTIAGVVAAIFFFNPTNQQQLYVWTTFIIFSPLLHYMMINRFTPNLENIHRLKRMISFYQLFSGCLWGMLAFIVIDKGSPMDIAVLTAIEAGALVSAVSSSMLRYVYVSFAVPVTILYCAAVFTASAADLKVMVILAVILLITMLLLSKRFYKELRASIQLRFENTDLLSKLEKANKDKIRFLAAASHDLRQPSQALGLFIESLDYIESDPEKKSIISKMRQTSEAMSGLLNQLLDISRLDANVISPEIQAIKLQPFLYQITMEHLGQAAQKGLALRFRPTDAIVYADPALLNRIIANLLSNALHYTKQGGILIAVRRSGANWRLAIYDTGIGIPENDNTTIFHEFTQLSNPERDREKGLGLGLAIVQRLTQMINGTVAVSSREHKGSCFSITLPSSTCEPEIIAFKQDAIADTNDLEGVKVLVIDDDKVVRDALKTLLTTWKCQVEIVASEEEAFQAIAHSFGAPDVLVVDYRLPQEKTGIEAIQAVFERLERSIPALILTGETSPQRIKMIEESGYPLLHKPTQANELKQTLSKLLKLA